MSSGGNSKEGSPKSLSKKKKKSIKKEEKNI